MRTIKEPTLILVCCFILFSWLACCCSTHAIMCVLCLLDACHEGGTESRAERDEELSWRDRHLHAFCKRLPLVHERSDDGCLREKRSQGTKYEV